jgi:DNA-binding transcriptional LysR family regulator
MSLGFNLDGLLAFVRVAEHGTFRLAAETLFITQPALSRRIRILETEVGVKLLDRTTRRVKLTIVGKRFLPRAQRLLGELSDSLSSLKDMGKFGIGQVSVACLPSVAAAVLPQLIREYSSLHPENRVRVLEVQSSEMVQTVLSGEVEFGITAWNSSSSEVEVTRLFDEPFVVVCPSNHPLSKKKQIKWKDLSSHRVIRVGRLNGRQYENQPAFQNIEPSDNWTYEVQHSFSTGLAMVDEGLGIIIAPKMVLKPDKFPSLVARPLISPAYFRTICVIRQKSTTPSPPAEDFLRLVKKRWATR